ncbi:hypothetical protein RIF29_18230 [Crotalaria pallida]|uniref:Uncharacterized protein n=1 Tax=Crotalaria pallida TaxID=3830 RepID=A0AAN9FPI0_CROPI
MMDFNHMKISTSGSLGMKGNTSSLDSRKHNYALSMELIYEWKHAIDVGEGDAFSLKIVVVSSCFFILTSSKNSSCDSDLIDPMPSLLPNLEAPYMQLRRQAWP